MSLRSRCILILLTLSTLLVGCSLGRMKSGSSSSSSSPSAAGGGSASSNNGNPARGITSFSPSSDARKDVSDALRRLDSSYPYRLTETATATANGPTMPESTRVIEFAAANRSHMKWTGGPGGDIEAISIGDKHYWFSGGKWTEGTIPSSLGYRGEDFANKLAEMVREVKYIGPETVNGLSCFAYTGTFETVMGGQKWSGIANIWIGAQDGLIHQSDSDFHVSTTNGWKSHTVYEYNVSFKIEPPI